MESNAWWESRVREYFGKEEKLRQELEKEQAFFVIGGNTFTLRMAMKYSGFDNYLKEISNNDKYLYAGYSAGICVLAPKLNGLDLQTGDVVGLYSANSDYNDKAWNEGTRNRSNSHEGLVFRPSKNKN